MKNKKQRYRELKYLNLCSSLWRNSIFAVSMATVMFATTALFPLSIVPGKTQSHESVDITIDIPEVESIASEEIIIEDVAIETVTNTIHGSPIEEETTTSEPIIEEETSQNYILTDEEIDLIALVTMAEAEGESELGQRLVIDVILNRVDSEKHPDTVHGVVYAPNQFSPMWNGRIDRCYVKDDIRKLVIEELESRTNYDVIYFRMNHYHKWGTPLFQEGNHYFSGV